MRPSRASRRAVAIVAAALLLTACGGGEEPAATPSPSPSAAAPSPSPVASPSPSPSPTPTEVDLASVPDDVDVAYVQAVMDELNRRETEAFRAVAETGEIDERFYAALKSLHTAADADRQVQGFEEAVGIDGLADPPGAITSEVQRIVFAGPDCIQAEVIHDIRPLLSPDVQVEPEQPYNLKLLRNEPNDLNPTAWAIDYLSWFDVTPCGE